MPLLGQGGEGVKPILVPKKSTDRDTTIDAPGFTINSHTLRMSLPREKVDAIKRELREQWPVHRRQAKAREVARVAGKLWNLRCVVRAGGYFVWRLLRLTELNDSAGSKITKIVRWDTARVFHAELLFRKMGDRE